MVDQDEQGNQENLTLEGVCLLQSAALEASDQMIGELNDEEIDDVVGGVAGPVSLGIVGAVFGIASGDEIAGQNASGQKKGMGMAIGGAVGGLTGIGLARFTRYRKYPNKFSEYELSGKGSAAGGATGEKHVAGELVKR